MAYNGSDVQPKGESESFTLTVLGRGGGCCRAGEACSGYLVRFGDFAVLLDCGSGVTGRLQEAGTLGSVNKVVISHWHSDHCSDAGVLYHGRLIQTIVGQAQGPLDFYAPGQEPDLGRLDRPPYARATAVDESSELRLGPLRLTFLRTRHPVYCLATKVVDPSGRTLVYTADGALTEELVAFCQGADLVVAECSLYAGVSGEGPGHMNADDVAALGRRAQPKRLVLSHLPLYGDRNDLLAPVRRGWDGVACLAEELATYPIEP